QHAVGVRDEPADVGLLHHILHTGGVSAFRQPDAPRIAPETTAVMIARGQNLRADGRRMLSEQREQRVGGCAGDDFEPATVLEFSKRAFKIAVISTISVADCYETTEEHFRKGP